MLQLQIRLCSDATFGSGDGVAGWLDTEVEHDEYGFPRVRGRTLKGLLVEECSNVLWSLSLQELPGDKLHRYESAAHFLFGVPGSNKEDHASLNVGPAQFPAVLRAVVATDVRRKTFTSSDILESLTAIRRQSAIDEATGAPDEGSLRSVRVILHGAVLTADLIFQAEPSADAKALLAACVLSLRRGGISRNRGRGRLRCSLWDDERRSEVTDDYLGDFSAPGGCV